MARRVNRLEAEPTDLKGPPLLNSIVPCRAAIMAGAGDFTAAFCFSSRAEVDVIRVDMVSRVYSSLSPTFDTGLPGRARPS